ncbi:hypothetical protein [Moraxella cuniculi]|nr:hypothetical protein [Moraxella cuniculi]
MNTNLGSGIDFMLPVASSVAFVSFPVVISDAVVSNHDGLYLWWELFNLMDYGDFCDLVDLYVDLDEIPAFISTVVNLSNDKIELIHQGGVNIRQFIINTQ